jgi:uncharacterized membrane protein
MQALSIAPTRPAPARPPDDARRRAACSTFAEIMASPRAAGQDAAARATAIRRGRSRSRPAPDGRRAAARPPRQQGSTRRALVDLIRGLAVALMLGYHFCYDLNYFHFVRFDFYNSPFWQGARVLILSLFLGVVGMSLHLATTDGIRWRPYLRRLLWILLAAALVSLSSYVVFPDRWIYFGVLHFIAAASVLGLAFRPLCAWNAPLGMAVIVVGTTVELTLFDQPWLQWIGLMTYKPPTEDYVPVLPWLGVVLLGTGVARILYGARVIPAFAVREYSAPGSRALIVLGRHSLLIYLAHQPIFMAMLFVAHALWR